MFSVVSSSSGTSWNKRLAALRNVPPVLRLVCDAAPSVVASGIALRLVSALIPLAILGVTKAIISIIEAKLAVTYDGTPQFKPNTGTPLLYALSVSACSAWWGCVSSSSS